MMKAVPKRQHQGIIMRAVLLPSASPKGPLPQRPGKEQEEEAAAAAAAVPVKSLGGKPARRT